MEDRVEKSSDSGQNLQMNRENLREVVLKDIGEKAGALLS